MSKSNMLLGLAKGKVGDLVFYRDGGEQRTRTRVIPKNPRSASQMAQRVRMANVPAFYRLLQPILKDSFSNRPSNQSGYNAFAKLAIEVSPYMTKGMSLTDQVLPAPYIISRGVIPSLPCEVDATSGRNLPLLPVDTTGNTDVTVGGWSRLIMAEYPQLQEGDVLTFVAVTYLVDEDSEGNTAVNAAYDSWQFTIDSTSTVQISSGDVVTQAAGLSPQMRSAEENTACAIIVSRRLADGSLRTSTSQLVLDAEAKSIYDGFRNEQALTAAIESYGRGEDSILR